MSIDAVLDHVAIAVPDADRARRRWSDELGGGLAILGDTPTFSSRQLRFGNGAKLELLAPPPSAPTDNFVVAFLGRFGAAVHHITLKVPDLLAAVSTLEAEGLSPVDVFTGHPAWHEAFLRPSQVGGIVVQVAWSGYSDEDWATEVGHHPEEPRAEAAALLGPTLVHDDLRAAATLWRRLGARVEETERALRCTWPDSPLDVVVQRGDHQGAVGLRMAGTPSLPAEEGVGPAVSA